MNWLTALLVASVAFTFAAAANAQETLTKSSGCLNCHAIDARKVGPSFKETAAKYKGTPDAEAKLAAEISAGKKHPSVKASAEDVKSLVKWVLAQ